MRSQLARPSWTVLPLMIAAAGVTYFLDPDNGRKRRGSIRERLTTTASRANTGAQQMRRGFFERTQHLAKRGKGLFVLDSESDEALGRRIRAAVADTVSRAGAIGASVREGSVTLHGDVLHGEHEPLLSAVRAVEGVRELTDHTRKRDAGDYIWSLHVPHEPREPGRFDYRQERWSPAARALSGVLGVGLLATAVGARRHPLGIAGGLLGAGLLLRAGVNRPLKRIGPGRGVIDVRRSIVVQAPVERVFRTLESFQNFPAFMRHVRRVTRHEDGTSHWAVAGPAGALIEWDALITAHRPNELLAWRSLSHSAVEHCGVIRFEPMGDGATRVDIHANYTPPGGRIGHSIARAVGADLGSALVHELERAKTFIETLRETAGAVGSGTSPSARAARSPRSPTTSGTTGTEDRHASDRAN